MQGNELKLLFVGLRIVKIFVSTNYDYKFQKNARNIFLVFQI